MSSTASGTISKPETISRAQRKILDNDIEVGVNWPQPAQMIDARQLVNIGPIILELLQSADRSLPNNGHGQEARRYLARAAAILRAEIEGDEDRVCAPTAEPGGLAPWQMNRIVAFVETNLSGPIRIRDLAALTQLSRSYLSQAFKDSFGVSPHAYVTRRRIIRAQEMMITTDRSLSEVALDCGLADQSHFSRLFRHIVGVSPNQWRRQRRQQPNG